MPSDNAEQIIRQIVQEKNLSEQEVRDMIRQKQDEYGGLLTQEGAALALARKYNISIADAFTKIRELSPNMRSITLRVKIDSAFTTREFAFEGGKSNVTNFAVSDDTGSARLVAWRQSPETLALLAPNAVVKITGAYVKRDDLGNLEIHVSRLGSVQIEKPSAHSLPTTRRVTINQLSPEKGEAEIRADIVQLYPPKTFLVCATCGGSFQNRCEKCGGDAPRKELVLNAELDDGTGTIRAAFYRKTAEQLLGFTAHEFEKSPAVFQTAEKSLLGEERVFTGEARQGINRTEFIVRSLKNADVHNEIKLLTEKHD